MLTPTLCTIFSIPVSLLLSNIPRNCGRGISSASNPSLPQRNFSSFSYLVHCSKKTVDQSERNTLYGSANWLLQRTIVILNAEFIILNTKIHQFPCMISHLSSPHPGIW